MCSRDILRTRAETYVSGPQERHGMGPRLAFITTWGGPQMEEGLGHENNARELDATMRSRKLPAVGFCPNGRIVTAPVGDGPHPRGASVRD
jgi:hypothetical protein